MSSITNKLVFWGLWPGKTQTNLLSYIRLRESWSSRYRTVGCCTIFAVNNKDAWPGPLGQSDVPSDWYSGRGFDPWSGHISFVEICSWNNFYSHPLPTADSCRVVVSYWWKYVHSALVNCLGSLLRNSVDRLTDWLDMTLILLNRQ